MRIACKALNLDHVAAFGSAEICNDIFTAAERVLDGSEGVDEGIRTRAARAARENVRAAAADENRTALAGFVSAAD